MFGSYATHKTHREDSDQTWRMPKLIWVFTGHKGHFVDFVMLQLKSEVFVFGYLQPFQEYFTHIKLILSEGIGKMFVPKEF